MNPRAFIPTTVSFGNEETLNSYMERVEQERAAARRRRWAYVVAPMMSALLPSGRRVPELQRVTVADFTGARGDDGYPLSPVMALRDLVERGIVLDTECRYPDDDEPEPPRAA